MKRPPQWLRKLCNTAEGLFAVNSGQKIVLWNRAAQQLLGHDEESVLGRRCYEVLDGRARRQGGGRCHADCRVQRSIQKGMFPPSFDIRSHAADGRDLCLNLSTIVLAANGSPLLIHIVKDVTSRARDKEALERIRETLKSAGYQPLRPAPAKGLARGHAPDPAADGTLARLTGREVEILSLVAGGSPNKKIATQLSLSVYTVRNHIQNALDKLGLHSKSQAVSYAYRNGLI